MSIRFLNHEMSSVHAAAFLLGAAALASRLVGVLRDRLLASHFGAGRELDIYYAAFQIPDLLSVIFLLGAGSAAILPVFQEYLGRDRAKASRLISQVASLFFVCAFVLAAIAFAAAPWLAHLAVPGFSASDRALTVVLMRIMMLSPILFGLSGIFSAVIQTFERFLSYALAPILYNLGIIAGILVFAPAWGVAGLALGVVLGAGLHLGAQYVSLLALGFRPVCALRPIDPGVRKIIALSGPRVLALSFTQLTIIALVGLASLLAAGSIAIFQFAQNLYYVPVGIFGISYSVAVFPRMNAAYLESDGPKFFREFSVGLRAILFWIVPSAALVAVLRREIVTVALGARAFSAQSSETTAACLGLLSLAIIAAAVTPHLVKSFYALENTMAPLLVDMAGSAVTVALAWLLMRIMHPQVLGLALGFSLGLAVNALLLYAALMPFATRVFGRRDSASAHEELAKPDIGMPLFKIIAASAVAAGTTAAARSVLFGFPLAGPAVLVFLRGLVAGGAGFAAYLSVLLLLKSETISFISHT